MRIMLRKNVYSTGGFTAGREFQPRQVSPTASAIPASRDSKLPLGMAAGGIHMTEQTDQVWHVAVPGLQPGQLYGYRVFGSYEPERGARFNSSKLLIDPIRRRSRAI